jgi:threonyl-tRNA synthetase
MAKSSYEETDLYRIRHSSAHVMAQAVMEMFPGEAKVAIGPPIADGFYYDFDLPRPLTPEDLGVIEERMRRTIAADHPFVHSEVGKDEARRLFAVHHPGGRLLLADQHRGATEAAAEGLGEGANADDLGRIGRLPLGRPHPR